MTREGTLGCPALRERARGRLGGAPGLPLLGQFLLRCCSLGIEIRALSGLPSPLLSRRLGVWYQPRSPPPPRVAPELTLLRFGFLQMYALFPLVLQVLFVARSALGARAPLGTARDTSLLTTCVCLGPRCFQYGGFLLVGPSVWGPRVLRPRPARRWICGSGSSGPGVGGPRRTS